MAFLQFHGAQVHPITQRSLGLPGLPGAGRGAFAVPNMGKAAFERANELKSKLIVHQRWKVDKGPPMIFLMGPLHAPSNADVVTATRLERLSLGVPSGEGGVPNSSTVARCLDPPWRSSQQMRLEELGSKFAARLGWSCTPRHKV